MPPASFGPGPAPAPSPPAPPPQSADVLCRFTAAGAAALLAWGGSLRADVLRTAPATCAVMQACFRPPCLLGWRLGGWSANVFFLAFFDFSKKKLCFGFFPAFFLGVFMWFFFAFFCTEDYWILA